MNPMALSYDQHFQSAIARLKMENRYRVFANLERDAARFPIALWRPEGEEDAPREVTIWCSNDYLGMGGHPAALDAARGALDRHGAGAGGTRNISTFTARSRRWFSPRAGSPISPASRPSLRSCPTV